MLLSYSTETHCSLYNSLGYSWYIFSFRYTLESSCQVLLILIGIMLYHRLIWRRIHSSLILCRWKNGLFSTYFRGSWSFRKSIFITFVWSGLFVLFCIYIFSSYYYSFYKIPFFIIFFRIGYHIGILTFFLLHADSDLTLSTRIPSPNLNWTKWWNAMPSFSSILLTWLLGKFSVFAFSFSSWLGPLAYSNAYVYSNY